jgi:hypothetical protein
MSGGELEWMRNYQASENSRTPSKRMRVGVSEVFFGERGRELPFLQSAARLIEKLGFDEMWLPEHVVFFQSYESKYPYDDRCCGGGSNHETSIRDVYLNFAATKSSGFRKGDFDCGPSHKRKI